jgi:hypothetical protein
MVKMNSFLNDTGKTFMNINLFLNKVPESLHSDLCSVNLSYVCEIKKKKTHLTQDYILL